MSGRWIVLLALVVLSSPSPSWSGGLPVVDVDAGVKLFMQYTAQLKQWSEQMQQTKNQYEQIYNQVKQIQHAATTVQHGVTNLTKLDLNHAQSLFGMVDTMSNKLAEAERIGYRARQAVSQAQGIYPQIQQALTAPQQQAYRRQWAEMQRYSAKIALEVQSIQEQQKAQAERLRQATEAAARAQGNLQAHQAQAQQQATMGAQLQSIESQLAVMGRTQALRDYREAAETEMELAAYQSTTKTLETTYRAQGKLLKLTAQTP